MRVERIEGAFGAAVTNGVALLRSGPGMESGVFVSARFDVSDDGVCSFALTESSPETDPVQIVTGRALLRDKMLTGDLDEQDILNEFIAAVEALPAGAEEGQGAA